MGERYPVRVSIRRWLTAALALTVLFAAAPARAAGDADGGTDYIVKYKSAAARLMDGGGGAPFDVVSKAEMERLDRAGLLEWYEPDGYAVLLDPEPDARLMGSVSPYYDDVQWNLDMIGADLAYRQNYLGRGVRVGVLDSGVEPHEYLKDSLVPGHNYMEDASDVSDTGDSYGHGTRVAGLVAAAGEDGYIGVALGAEIVPIKITDGKSVKVSVICRAIYGGIDEYHCDVLNLSLGVTKEYESLREAIDYAEERNVVVVSAAGNGGTQTMYYPARYDTVIGVGSVDSNGATYYRSNHNASVFITAPGVDVRSTAAAGGFLNCTGTSFSVPQAAGAAAVLMGIDPDLTPGGIRDLMSSTASDQGEEGYDEYYGYGVLNLAGCVTALTSGSGESSSAGSSERASDPERPSPSYDECLRDETCVLAPYADLDRNAWYHDGVHYALAGGMMNGTGEGAFSPSVPASRAMLVTMLWRLEGQPAGGKALSFTDVQPDAWYAEAVRWAAAEGVAGGYSETRFGPDDSVSREQLAAILSRYAAYRGESGSAGGTELLGRYPDNGQISPWARDAMGWAVRLGLIEGTDGGRLSPGDPAGRAQLATILMRYAEAVGNE